MTDLVQKAQGMGIKVWTVTKLTELLSKLAPPQQTALKADNLSAVLEDERIHGTRERDLNAPRADHYYFKPGNKFVLVEDATGKSRTIIAKEYESAEPYPCIFQTFLRPANVAATGPISNPRARAWALYVDRVPFNGERPPAELRRCVSAADLQRLQAPSTPLVPEPVPYQNASGNSVVITDAVGSTSTANNTPAFHPALNRAAIAQMSKRVQVLKNNVQRDSQTRRASTGFTAAPIKQTVTQEQLVRMLRQPCQWCEKYWVLNAGRWPPPCDDEHGPDEDCEKCHPGCEGRGRGLCHTGRGEYKRGWAGALAGKVDPGRDARCERGSGGLHQSRRVEVLDV